LTRGVVRPPRVWNSNFGKRLPTDGDVLPFRWRRGLWYVAVFGSCRASNPLDR